MTLQPIPAFKDNYIWMIHDGRTALVVDPGDASPVMQALDEARLDLGAILVTHHHADHVGGIEGLRGRLAGPVYGPEAEPVPQPCVSVRGGQQVLALGLNFHVMDVPGHTAGHVAFYAEDFTGGPVLFCGDTLFSAGCGRLFEGTAAQMHASLQRLSALPGSTRVCCAHEYTLSNLKFAASVEPGNTQMRLYTRWCEQQRAIGLPTLPSTIQTELQVNPFLRCSEPEVMAAAASQSGSVSVSVSSPVEVLAALRAWKNRF